MTVAALVVFSIAGGIAGGLAAYATIGRHEANRLRHEFSLLRENLEHTAPMPQRTWASTASTDDSADGGVSPASTSAQAAPTMPISPAVQTRGSSPAVSAAPASTPPSAGGVERVQVDEVIDVVDNRSTEEPKTKVEPISSSSAAPPPENWAAATSGPKHILTMGSNTFELFNQNDVWLLSRSSGTGSARLGSTEVRDDDLLPVSPGAAVVTLAESPGPPIVRQVPSEYVTTPPPVGDLILDISRPTQFGRWIYSRRHRSVLAGIWVPADVDHGISSSHLSEVLDSLAAHVVPGRSTAYVCESLVRRVNVPAVGQVVISAGRRPRRAGARDSVVISVAASNSPLAPRPQSDEPLSLQLRSTNYWELDGEASQALIDRRGTKILAVEAVLG